MDDHEHQQHAAGAAVVRYRLRSDLVFAEHDEGGRKSTVLKDPRSQKYYYFNEVTCAVLRMFDGETSVEDVPARFAAEDGRKLSSKSIDGLISRAQSLGLFENDQAAGADEPAEAEDKKSRRTPFNILYIRLPAFDPSPVLAHLGWLGKILFSWPAYALLLGALTWCSYLQFFDSYTRYYNSFYVFQYFDGWVATWFLLGISGVLHEFGHALAVQRYGGEVREMGFLLYLLKPALYTNASDAALMPRAQRIMVSLAGVYVEGFIYCVTVLLWYYYPPFSTVGNIAFIAGFVLFTRILMNLIPLLRLDGYFILRDLLGVPNLRPRSFKYLLSRLPVVGPRFRGKQPPKPREQRIFLIYGSLSVATVVYFLGNVYWRTYETWGHHWEWWIAAAIVTAIIAATIRRRILKSMQGSSVNESHAPFATLGGPR